MNTPDNREFRARSAVLIGLCCWPLSVFGQTVVDVRSDAFSAKDVSLSPGTLAPVVQRTAGIRDEERLPYQEAIEHVDAFSAADHHRAALAEQTVWSRRLQREGRSGILLNAVQETPEAFSGRPVVVYGWLERWETHRVVVAGVTQSRTWLWFRPVSGGQRWAVLDLPSDVNRAGVLPGAPLAAAGLVFKLLRSPIDGQARDVPLMIARGDSLQWITPALPPGLCHRVQHRQPLQAGEETAYYRILHHARLVPLEQQRQQSRAFRQQRMRPLSSDKSDDGYSTFRDIFLNPESCVCQSVTLTGHVQTVTQFPAAENPFGLQTLYQVHLFPDDGQRNLAVVICSALPKGLPLDSGVVDGVSVTGYFFKMYRYPADDPRDAGRQIQRIAPLILASRVDW
ncbi:MAG: hypothetical protein ABGZ17_15810, partial [Planctomycetaceae bacterium]